MIRIYGHSWETRHGGKDEKKIFKVYSNCSEVELIVNGKKLSKESRNSQDYPAAGLRWAVNLEEGTNTIKAIGYNGGEVVEDELSVNYQTAVWSEPAAFKLSQFSEKGDTVTLKVEVFDANGIKCLDANNKVRFAIAGDGEMIDNLGTSTASSVVQLYNGHAYLSCKKNNGYSVISVSAEGIPTQFLEIR